MPAERILDGDTLKVGKDKLNKAIDQANTAEVESAEAVKTSGNAVSIANTAKASADSTRTELDAVVVRETDSDAMSRQAAVDAEGVDQVNLKARLDKEYNLVSQRLSQMNQFNFLEYIKENKIGYDEIILKKHNSLNHMHIIFCRGNKHITYQLRPNEIDDYMVLGEIFFGELSFRDSGMAIPTAPATNLTGTWVTVGTYYTTEVGATFEAVVTAQKVFFNARHDNNGGVWEFTINGDEKNRILVSVYADEAIPTKEVLIAELEKVDTVHVKARFLGADPLRPPVSGTARGWINQNSTFTMKYIFTENAITSYLSPASNKEFAFRMRAENQGEHEFVPSHGEPSAIARIPRELWVDEQLIDVSSMLNNTMMKNINNIRLVQSIHAMNTASAEPLARIDIITNILPDGETIITGKMTVLQNIEISTGYPLMVPVGDFASRLVTGLMNEYLTDTPIGTNAVLEEEHDKVASGVFLSDTHRDYAVGYCFGDIARTLRHGEPKSSNPQWLERRDLNLQKLYNQIFLDTKLTVGEVYRWNGKLIYAEVANINNLF